MKIDVTGGYGIYRGQKSGESAKLRGVVADRAKQTADVADFAHGSTAISDKAFVSLKAAIQRDINTPASPERLAELRAAIKSGTYQIPTEALVDSILGE